MYVVVLRVHDNNQHSDWHTYQFTVSICVLDSRQDKWSTKTGNKGSSTIIQKGWFNIYYPIYEGQPSRNYGSSIVF